jgi:cellulose synthase/poly-beta-1,6-N-acetylglucosamine synthase-like glycosyltransferase
VTWVAAGLLVAALPAALDAVLRLVLSAASRRWRFQADERLLPHRWLVLVPSRGEGAAVEATLRSLVSASAGREIRVVLVLDGDDSEAAEVGRSLGVTVATKPVAGPSKAAALRWVATTLAGMVTDSDAVLLLDVGSQVSPGFFEAFAWPRGADAVQAFLKGGGTAVGAAAAHSERVAQRREDRGRQVLGWRVRLRGTGMAMSPAVFLHVVPRLRSTVEDLEISLLLAADGRTLCLAPAEAVVMDEKPATVAGAARQRTRWFAGRFSLLWLQRTALWRLASSRPVEGCAFLVELFSRPLTLTIPLRLLAAGALVFAAPATTLGAAVVAAVVALSTVTDTVWAATGNGFSPGSAVRLAAAWVGALVLLPRAVAGWVRVRQPRG